MGPRREGAATRGRTGEQADGKRRETGGLEFYIKRGGAEEGSKGSRGRGGRKSKAGDLMVGRRQCGARGGRVSRSGQRLGNIAVVLPPPWPRNILHNDPPTIHRLSKNKTKLATLVLNLVTLDP